ncbi:hypothetical protein FJY71_06005 [candidate division WOR-3 bacterium]|nr:hypothetical protein [candidate division WOR-3 bacterium]
MARTDSDLREAIKSHWNEYEFFWYEPAVSARDAYVNQCYAFHRYADRGELQGGQHPLPPEKADVQCPICGGRH